MNQLLEEELIQEELRFLEAWLVNGRYYKSPACCILQFMTIMIEQVNPDMEDYLDQQKIRSLDKPNELDHIRCPNCLVGELCNA